LIAAGLFFVPILAFRRARRAGARNRALAMIVTGALGLPWLLVWLYGVVALSRLSLPLLLLLAGTSAALFEYLRRRYSRARQPSLKVGRA
jgi:peptidoglycan/LPS O-acetylase OafA/YrhL